MFKEKHSDDPVNAKLMCMLYGKIPMQVVSNEDKEEADMQMEEEYIEVA